MEKKNAVDRIYDKFEEACPEHNEFPKKLSVEADRIVYHYTDWKGLNGILKGRMIWATHTDFLNDISENQIATQRVRDFLSEWLFSRANEKTDARRFLQDYIGNICAQVNSNHSIYAASFSSKGDSLAQWRGYGAMGQGFSLGFDTNVLNKLTERKASEKEALFFSRLCYDESKQKEQTKNQVEPALDVLFRNYPGGRDHPDGLNAQQALNLWLLSSTAQNNALMKHPAFEEEEECRLWLIDNTLSEESQRPLSFRPGARGPIPYLEIPLWEEGELAPLREIIVGPGNSQNTVDVLRAYLRSLSLKLHDAFTIKASAIPFRG